MSKLWSTTEIEVSVATSYRERTGPKPALRAGNLFHELVEPFAFQFRWEHWVYFLTDDAHLQFTCTCQVPTAIQCTVAATLDTTGVALPDDVSA